MANWGVNQMDGKSVDLTLYSFLIDHKKRKVGWGLREYKGGSEPQGPKFSYRAFPTLPDLLSKR